MLAWLCVFVCVVVVLLLLLLLLPILLMMQLDGSFVFLIDSSFVIAAESMERHCRERSVECYHLVSLD